MRQQDNLIIAWGYCVPDPTCSIRQDRYWPLCHSSSPVASGPEFGGLRVFPPGGFWIVSRQMKQLTSFAAHLWQGPAQPHSVPHPSLGGRGRKSRRGCLQAQNWQTGSGPGASVPLSHLLLPGPPPHLPVLLRPQRIFNHLLNDLSHPGPRAQGISQASSRIN